MPDKPTIRETVRIRLEELSDPEYREFHSRLLPGITGIMGVRTPELRGIAKDLKKSGWREYIKEVSCAWKEKGQGADGVLYDEMIIWGLCICGGCRDWDTAGEYVTAFVPAINNWAVCDIFSAPLKSPAVTGKRSGSLSSPISNPAGNTTCVSEPSCCYPITQTRTIWTVP